MLEGHLASVYPDRGLYHIVTYGCQMNVHESEKLAGILEEIGFKRAADPTTSDVLILNTCCVRDSAEQRILGHIGTLKKLKVERPHMRIGVIGCMSQQQGMAEHLLRTFPFLDFVMGTQDVAQLVSVLDEAADAKHRLIDRATLNDSVEMRDSVPMIRTGGPCAYVNIMYGCNNYCSYCIVPYVRGPERSRSISSILTEIATLESAGCREVTLLGQNVNSYAAEGNSFAQLLKEILKGSSIDRFRFMTSHPKDLSEDLIELMGREPRVQPQLHLPLQSGSDAVLESMNRGYTSAQYANLVECLRSAVPNVGLTTDLIVGYPGETEADFEATLSMVERIRFHGAYTFVYSKRRGTLAASMPDQVSREIKRDRIMRLIETQNCVTSALNANEVGKVREVLVSGLSARNPEHLTGRTAQGTTVNFAGSSDLIGKILPIRITEAKRTTLFGQLEEYTSCRS